MILGPGPVLALLVGVFHVSIYVLIRGRAEQRVPILLLAAFLGAWAGDALAGRLGIDPLRIGDFHLIGASVLAWVGIVVVAIIAVLGERQPSRRIADAHPIATTARRAGSRDGRRDAATHAPAAMLEHAAGPAARAAGSPASGAAPTQPPIQRAAEPAGPDAPEPPAALGR